MRNFIDVAVNLTDQMYKGIYNGKTKHQEDVLNVLNRAFNSGVEKLLILSSSLSDSYEALKLSNKNDNLKITVGCHPTNCNEFIDNEDSYLNKLKSIVLENNEKVAAIGECGLDYDRENFCPRDVQKTFFVKQIELAIELKLPLYLHCRAAHDDLISILSKYQKQLVIGRPGLVHTFDGTLEQGQQLLDMGFYLGINGCSLKTQASLDVVKLLPLERLVIETDSPWCDVRSSHAGYKYVKTFMDSNKKERWDPNLAIKGRNEPSNVIQIFQILCGIRMESPDIISDILYRNSEKLFF